MIFTKLLKQSERPGIYTIAEDRGGQLLLYVTADKATADYRGNTLVIRDGNRLATEAEYQSWAAKCEAARARVKPVPPGMYKASRQWQKRAGCWVAK